MEHSAHATQHQPDSASPQSAGPGAHTAHNKHAGHDPDAFRRQFWVVLLLTIPVVLWSREVQQWLGYSSLVPGCRMTRRSSSRRTRSCSAASACDLR